MPGPAVSAGCGVLSADGPSSIGAAPALDTIRSGASAAPRTIGRRSEPTSISGCRSGASSSPGRARSTGAGSTRAGFARGSAGAVRSAEGCARGSAGAVRSAEGCARGSAGAVRSTEGFARPASEADGAYMASSKKMSRSACPAGSGWATGRVRRSSSASAASEAGAASGAFTASSRSGLESSTDRASSVGWSGRVSSLVGLSASGPAPSGLVAAESSVVAVVPLW